MPVPAGLTFVVYSALGIGLLARGATRWTTRMWRR
jgi:hypothetical protein